jgi:hypothetical protein
MLNSCVCVCCLLECLRCLHVAFAAWVDLVPFQWLALRLIVIPLCPVPCAGVPPLPLDDNFLPPIKDRVNLARKVDAQLNAQHKVKIGLG